MRFNFFIIVVFSLFVSSLTLSSSNDMLISNKEYITGDDGVIRMYVNVIGHVKKPGVYLVYDGIDYMSVLSIAGGYLPGSNLNEILVLSKDGSSNTIDLDDFYENPDSYFLQLKPHDTVYVKQKFLSKIFTSTNLPSVILSILNIALTLERTN